MDTFKFVSCAADKSAGKIIIRVQGNRTFVYSCADPKAEARKLRTCTGRIYLEIDTQTSDVVRWQTNEP